MNPLAPCRVVVADDHVLFRAGLVALLRADPRVHVVAEAGDGDEALAAVAAHAPDVLVLDISMPGVKVLMLSMHASEAYVQQAFDAGAAGYLVKDAAPTELAVALDAVRAGQRYLSPSAATSLLAPPAAPAHAQLTPRQLEILRLVAEGQSTKHIARALDLSTKTVDAHRHQICQRLGVHDVASLVRYAIRHRLVRVE